MILPRISSKLTIWALVILLMATGVSCKSKKAAMSATDAAAEKAKMEQEAAMRKQEEAEAARNKALLEEKAKMEADMKRRESEPYNKLQNYFAAISSANSVTSANSNIAEALNLFASKDTPVLIVISEEGGQKDYDRPTTIGQYLNYLKDQKKNMNKINHLQLDASGKITEVELVKQ